MHQQLWGYKVEEQVYLGVRERRKWNITGLEILGASASWTPVGVFRPVQE